MDFASKLSQITESARFLASLDIVEINFLSGHSLDLYVASSLQQRSRGLSNLPSLDADGMLFFYPQGSTAQFTVAEMLFDIDISFYGKDGKLLDVQRAEAGSLIPVTASQTFYYVIEAPAGSIPFTDLQVNSG